MVRSSRVMTMAAAAALFANFAAAQDDEAEAFDRTPEECISVSRIDRTEVLDDRTVIFHMRGRREAYRNYLPRSCPNLDRSKRFMYEIRSGRLCDIDTITVLEQFGTRLERGFTCQLGAFYPVTQEDIEELRAIAERGRAEAIEASPAELPDDE